MSGRYGAQIALGALLEARRLIDDSIRAIVMQICLDERGNPIHMCGKPALEHLREHHPDAGIREEDGKVTLPSLDDALANEALAAGVLGGIIQKAVRELIVAEGYRGAACVLHQQGIDHARAACEGGER